MASSYYDKILESFDNPEAESIYDEGILDEGILDESSYDEALFNRRKRPVKVPASLGRPSNFGRNVSPSAGNGQAGFVSKAELKRSLDSISEQVNDLKKSGVTLASSIKRLDDGYEKIVKGIARKDRSQDSFLSSSTMMTLLSTIANKPTLNSDALSIVRGANGERIEVKPGQDAVQVDMTKTMLFTMLPTLTSGGSSSDNNNAMMMMMMVLLLDKNRNTSGSSNNDNTLLLMMPMLMMNKK